MNPASLKVAVLPWGPEARSKGRARASSLTGEPWKGQKLSMASPPILVIDSSLSVRVNLQHALMAAGFEVIACDGSAAGRRAIQARGPALAIIDAAILDNDGGALVREARSGVRGRQVPIVVLSPDGKATSRILRLTADAVDYIGKPAGPAFVVRRVQKLVGAQTSTNGAASFGLFSPARILFVDGSGSSSNRFADRLRAEGHDVIAARSPAEAVGFLEVQSVDCIVLDPSTSGLGGLEMSRRVRAGRGASSVPVMLLTEREDPMTRAAYASAGIDDSIVKSTDLTAMGARLGALMRRRSSQASGLWVAPRASESPRVKESLSELLAMVTSGADPEARITPLPTTTTPFPTPLPTPLPASAAALAEDAHPDDRSSSSGSPRSPRPRMTPPPPPSSPGLNGPSDVPPSGIEFSPLFEQVLDVSGLQHLVGRGGLRRAFERAGVDPRALTPEGLERAIPEIMRTLSIFLSKEEVAQSGQLIAALVRKAQRGAVGLPTARGA